MEKIHETILWILGGVFLAGIFLDDAIVGIVSGWTLDNILFFLFSSISMVLLVVILSIFLFKDGERKRLILPMWISFVGSYFVSVVIKLIIARPRFFMEEFIIFGIPNYSFPSSHATMVFAVLPFLMAKTWNLRWAWIIYAGLVAVSRLLLKHHYLSDVAAGALLGYGVGLAVLYVYNKKFKEQ